jgi:predicted ATPase
MKALPLRTIRIENFKAIRDTGTLRLGPLTVLVGNNGSGKSSLIEAMETVRRLSTEGLDAAMRTFWGFEHVLNKQAASHGGKGPAISVRWTGTTRQGATRAEVTIRPIEEGRALGLTEVTQVGKERIAHADDGPIIGGPFDGVQLRPGVSLLSLLLDAGPGPWQFLSLEPGRMGDPRTQKRTTGPVVLDSLGANVGEYLLSLREVDNVAFEGLIETLRAVLPYADDVQPHITSELERAVYLQLTEGGVKVPGWLLSSGTLRILALLAVLRHPKPPPVVFIEEIENGLDPRTLHLVVRELQRAAEGSGPQVIATTHSPFFLDLLPLSSLMFVERIDGEPVFTRPADDAAVRAWSERFSPGQLYTMGRFDRGGAA